MKNFTVEQNTWLLSLLTDNPKNAIYNINKHSEKPKVDGKYKLIDLHKFLNMNADGLVEKNETLGILYEIGSDNLFDIRVHSNIGRSNGSDLILPHEWDCLELVEENR